MGTRLYIGNLSYDTTEQELQELFAQVGPVNEISLPTDRDTGRVRGFAFVEMANETDAQEAIRRFNGSSLRNRQINVNEARPREERGGGGGAGRSSYGGGGGYGGGGRSSSGGRRGGGRDSSGY